MLPDLPKIINKKEQSITPRILAWFRDNYKENFALEIKVSYTNTLPHSKVEKHQLQALQLAENGFLVHKIVDTGTRNPFDAFGLYKVKSWIVIYFIKHKKFVAISPRTFVQTKQIRYDMPSELDIF